MKAKLILDYVNKKSGQIYSEGEVEDRFLSVLESSDWRKKISDEMEKGSWPFVYHFSSKRENLLSWYPFKKDGSLLEIGSGCGSLTGLFTRALKNVTAIELSQRRAQITASRHKNQKNLTVIAGNMNDMNLKNSYDYVTSIGVLEYAGKYTDSENPYFDFLVMLRSYLKKNGTLILAIENKFGLKYWAGAREDHAGNIFESIEDYKNERGVRTFSKKELEEILAKVGFKNIIFYYPLPDYKLPVEIFSDKYPPTLKHNVRSGLFPYADPAQEREYLFSEKLANDGIVAAGEFAFFANSFLVFAERGEK